MSPKTAILLVAFGTSHADAQKSLMNVQTLAEKRFPGIPIRWAYTSEFIRRKLAKQGVLLDSPTLAMAKLLDEGFRRVGVQSLHTIPGIEFDDLRAEVDRFRTGPGSFERIELGAPLLADYATLCRSVDAMLAAVPRERKKDEPVIFMGHGSERHFADLMYVAFQRELSARDERAFVGTVEGHPTFDDVLRGCQAARARKAWVMPFMAVAGDHAKNDMAGDDADSWTSRLKAAGIEPAPILVGTADNQAIVDIWLDNLAGVLKAMGGVQ